MEWALTILIFGGVMAVTALVFGVWLVVTLLRLVVRGIVAMFTWPAPPRLPSGARGAVCPNNRCRAVNSGGARFCRRCGSKMPAVQHVQVRRAAMW